MVPDFNDFTETVNLQSLFPIKVTTVDQVPYFESTSWAVIPGGILGHHVCEFSVGLSFVHIYSLINCGELGSNPVSVEQLTW